MCQCGALLTQRGYNNHQKGLSKAHNTKMKRQNTRRNTNLVLCQCGQLVTKTIYDKHQTGNSVRHNKGIKDTVQIEFGTLASLSQSKAKPHIHVNLVVNNYVIDTEDTKVVKKPRKKHKYPKNRKSSKKKQLELNQIQTKPFSQRSMKPIQQVTVSSGKIVLDFNG